MTDAIETIDSDSESEDVQFVRSRKLSCKQNDNNVEKHEARRFKKQKPRPKRPRLIKSAAPSVTTDFVSSRRVTRRIGLFSKGKTSTKVSRFEFVASAETKARAEQDLHKILNLAHDTHNAAVATDKSQQHTDADVSSKKCCHHKSSGKIKKNSESVIPENSNMASSSHQNTSRMFNSADKNVETLSAPQTKKSVGTKKCSQSSQPSVDLGGIVKRLHTTLNRKRGELFPGVSLKSTLKSELFALQRQIKISRTECRYNEIFYCRVSSQTNTNAAIEAGNAGPSVKLDDPTPAVEPADPNPTVEADFSLKPQTFPQDNNKSATFFKLDFHPESLPCSSPVKQWLFSIPTKEERIFSNLSKDLEERQPMCHGVVCNDYVCEDPHLLYTQSTKRKPNIFSLLTSASPDSDGQMTWQIKSSPHKLPVEDSPSSSWNYLRCKMY